MVLYLDRYDLYTINYAGTKAEPIMIDGVKVVMDENEVKRFGKRGK